MQNVAEIYKFVNLKTLPIIVYIICTECSIEIILAFIEMNQFQQSVYEFSELGKSFIIKLEKIA